MTLPAKISNRLNKLLALLGSDHDGEAAAAARAISRTLKSAGQAPHARVAPRDVVQITGKPCRISPTLRQRIREMAKEGKP